MRIPGSARYHVHPVCPRGGIIPLCKSAHLRTCADARAHARTHDVLPASRYLERERQVMRSKIAVFREWVRLTPARPAGSNGYCFTCHRICLTSGFCAISIECLLVFCGICSAAHNRSEDRGIERSDENPRRGFPITGMYGETAPVKCKFREIARNRPRKLRSGRNAPHPA